MAPVVSRDASKTVSSEHEATAVREGVVAKSSVAVSGVATTRAAIKEGGHSKLLEIAELTSSECITAALDGRTEEALFSGRSLVTVRRGEPEGAAIFRQDLRPVGVVPELEGGPTLQRPIGNC